MNRLVKHLQDVDPLDYFSPEEMNYIILFTYGILAAATREGCDAIAFSVNAVTWSRDGLPGGQRQESSLQSMTFREAMRQIIAHDPVVREAFHPVKRNSPVETDSYRIEYPTLAAVATGDGAARHEPTMRS